MTYGELKQAIENGDYDDYTDMVDATMEISLLEYGIIRNPETTECLFLNEMVDQYDMTDDDKAIVLKSCDVSISDVRDYLIDESSKGFFTFIGSSLEIELKRLDNNDLAHIIRSINQYDGYFNN